MPEAEIVEPFPTARAEAQFAGLGLSEFIRYGAAIAKVVELFREAEKLKLGDTMILETLKTDIGSKQFEWEMGHLKRSK